MSVALALDRKCTMGKGRKPSDHMVKDDDARNELRDGFHHRVFGKSGRSEFL
jgi:hypothetical protein